MQKNKKSVTKRYTIDGRNYKVEVFTRTQFDDNVVRIIIPTFMPNEVAKQVTDTCIASIKKFTEESVEIWLVDNGSPERYLSEYLEDQSINVAWNKTEPLSPRFRGIFPRVKHWLRRGYKGARLQAQDVSYANSIGLEIGVRLINQDTRHVVTLHSDTMVLDRIWLPYFRNKLNEKTRIASFRSDPGRVYAAHIGGMLFDFQVYKRVGTNFLHNLRQERSLDSPEYDVGDHLSISFSAAGYSMFISDNTFNTPELENKIRLDSPLRDLPCDRCLTDKEVVFFAHLGRGATKSFANYKKGLGPEDWVRFANNQVLRN